MSTQALSAELLKLKRSSIVWATFIAFALAPVMGGIFMLIVSDPDMLASSGSFGTKARMMDFTADWPSYIGLITQAVGVGGILVFGFVGSWLFGREYTDGTAKDLLALPTSRTSILNAKFIIYALWCLCLVISNLLIALLIGIMLQIPLTETAWILPQLSDYFITTLLTILPGLPIAFFALWGKGYLAPLGFVALTLVFSQIIGAVGYGNYFPWAVPGLYSYIGGGFKSQLNVLSYLILFLTGAAGYFASLYYWRRIDQTK